jgi:hypothetical protein
MARALVPVLAVVLLALLGPAGAGAASLRGGTAGRPATLHLTMAEAAALRPVRGTRAGVACSTVERVPGGYARDTFAERRARIPRRGRAIPAPRLRHADYCTIAGSVSRGATAGFVFLSVPVTAAGATYVDESATVALLDVPLQPPDGPPLPIFDVLGHGGGRVVALAGPDATPPYGKAGYWTDGTRVVVAAVSRAGRRFFLDRTGDVWTTNALAYLT